jgi:hypothetical protein
VAAIITPAMMPTVNQARRPPARAFWVSLRASLMSVRISSI